VGSSLVGHEMYVLRCLLGIPLNMEMQLSNHVSRSEIQSSSQPWGLEMQLTNYIYSWVHHWTVTLGLSTEMWLRNCISRFKLSHWKCSCATAFPPQGSVSNRKCSCATAFPGQSLSIKPEMQLHNCISRSKARFQTRNAVAQLHFQVQV
jgi:hypothetical protein